LEATSAIYTALIIINYKASDSAINGTVSCLLYAK
jgi:hypothetical protein